MGRRSGGVVLSMSRIWEKGPLLSIAATGAGGGVLVKLMYGLQSEGSDPGRFASSIVSAWSSKARASSPSTSLACPTAESVRWCNVAVGTSVASLGWEMAFWPGMVVPSERPTQI